MTDQVWSAKYEAPAESVLSAIEDRELRAGIARIFALAQTRIDSGEINLVIIAARRLSCLYQLLLKAGMPPLTGCTVVSNRVLDANPNVDWPSTNVLVLDDSVVVGTTLHRLRSELSSFGASTISCLAVCIDTNQRVEYLLDDNFQFLVERDTAGVNSFSKQVVQSLFWNQIPFFTDYPTTVALDIPKDSWQSYLTDGRWHLGDVTAPMLDDHVHVAFVQVPSEVTFARVLGGLPPAVSALVDGFKVRLYVADEVESVRIVTVPIALLAPSTPAELDDALRAICDSTASGCQDPVLDKLDHASWDPKAKHRLVQLYVSVCVLAEIWPSLTEAAFGTPATLKVEDLEDQQVRLYFGDDTDSVLQTFSTLVESYKPGGTVATPPSLRHLDQPTPSQFLDEEAVEDLLWDAREVIAATGIPVEPNRDQFTKLGLLFAHAISAIFGYINRVYELPQRQDIASLSGIDEYNELYGDRSRRLLYQGFTIRELTTAIVPEALQGSLWKRSVVSLGIDAGNDLGVIVPVTRHDENRGLVYRCYRLGETASLADRPLSEAVNQTEVVLDEMSQSAAHGFPVESIALPIGQALVPPDRSGSIGDLVDIVREVTPGKAIRRFVGTVTAVDGDRFQAGLRDPVTDEYRLADMELDQLLPHQAAALSAGTQFLWTLRQTDQWDARTRHSRIRILERAPLNIDQLRAAGAAITKERPARG